jgi:hypothetical protein
MRRPTWKTKNDDRSKQGLSMTNDEKFEADADAAFLRLRKRLAAGDKDVADAVFDRVRKDLLYPSFKVALQGDHYLTGTLLYAAVGEALSELAEQEVRNAMGTSNL